MSSKNSLEKVLAVLEVFTETRLEWTPEELMQELGYSRPTLYRYLKTLKDSGFLTSAPTGGFCLGPKIVEMDFLVKKSDKFVHVGQSYLKELTQKFQCRALLARWYGNKLLCVANEHSREDANSVFLRGRPMELSRGAVSQTILANLPRRKLMPLIDQNFTSLVDVGLGDDPNAIATSLRRIRRKGYAIARGEIAENIIGIAAPVFDTSTLPIGSLAVTVVSGTINETVLSRLADVVREYAEGISTQLSDLRANNTADLDHGS